MDKNEPSLPNRRLRVLFATSELFPLAKTGGLGDVAAALPAALGALGVDARAILPGYISALDSARGKRLLRRLPEGGALLLAYTPDTGLPVYLVDRPDLFRRAGGPYQDATKQDWPDNLRRFAGFSAVVAALALGGDGASEGDFQPDLVHANDWHTGLVMAYLALADGPRPASLFTIHNLAYQGNFPLAEARALGLPEALFATGGAEFYGQLSCLKAGIVYADRITTVSPTYAREILTPEHGAGLHGVLRARAADLIGIRNGIDARAWNPAEDPALAFSYDAARLSGKALNKAALRHELGLDAAASGPLVIGVNRLTHQKMADIVLAALPGLLAAGAQVVLHGQGDQDLEAALRAASAGREGQLVVRIGYEEAFAHRLHAAADLALTPARFEPCGLTTLYAMRYGALPVTRPVGGIADSVVDLEAGGGQGTGFAFSDPTVEALVGAIARARRLFADEPAWRAVQRRVMGQDFGWAEPARRYLGLYCALLPEAARSGLPCCAGDADSRDASAAVAAPVAAHACEEREAA